MSRLFEFIAQILCWLVIGIIICTLFFKYLKCKVPNPKYWKYIVLNTKFLKFYKVFKYSRTWIRTRDLPITSTKDKILKVWSTTHKISKILCIWSTKDSIPSFESCLYFKYFNIKVFKVQTTLNFKSLKYLVLCKNWYLLLSTSNTLHLKCFIDIVV